MFVCVYIHFYPPGFGIPLRVACWPRQRAAGRQTEQILICCPQLLSQVPISGSCNKGMASHLSNCAVPQKEKQVEIQEFCLTGGRKVFRGHWGREDFWWFLDGIQASGESSSVPSHRHTKTVSVC